MARNESLDTFRASVMAKITAWKAVLDSYDAAVSLDGALGEVAANSHQARPESGKPTDLPVGVFRDKSIREAIEIYLGAGRRPQANKEIAQGLQKGGIPTTSKYFEATVATALGRMKEDGLVLRFSDGWDLAASYSDSFRSRVDKDTKATKPRRKEKKVRARTAATKVANKAPKKDKTAIILKMIADGANGQSVSDLGAGLKLLGIEASKDYIRVVARRLNERGKIQLRDGKYYAA